MRFPIIPCTLCGSQDGLERERMREMLDGLERARPEIRATMWAALQNVSASHLADAALFDFNALTAPRKTD
jgi:tRNA 2-thiocytidine biosynthesis protein TtcA